MDSLADWAAPRLALDVITYVGLKATVILGLAWLATVLLRRASARACASSWPSDRIRAARVSVSGDSSSGRMILLTAFSMIVSTRSSMVVSSISVCG